MGKWYLPSGLNIAKRKEMVCGREISEAVQSTQEIRNEQIYFLISEISSLNVTL
jgi:hypothetical protein